jgi:hypothetical protein
MLISDALLTSTPDPTGEKQKHTGKGITTFKHGIDAMRIQNDDMTSLGCSK